MLEQQKRVPDQVQLPRRDHARLDLQRLSVRHAAEVEQMNKQLKQLAKLFYGQTGTFNDRRHSECINGIVSWNCESVRTVGHNKMFSLTGDAESRLLEGPDCM